MKLLTILLTLQAVTVFGIPRLNDWTHFSSTRSSEAGHQTPGLLILCKDDQCTSAISDELISKYAASPEVITLAYDDVAEDRGALAHFGISEAQLPHFVVFPNAANTDSLELTDRKGLFQTLRRHMVAHIGFINHISHEPLKVFWSDGVREFYKFDAPLLVDRWTRSFAFDKFVVRDAAGKELLRHEALGSELVNIFPKKTDKCEFTQDKEGLCDKILEKYHNIRDEEAILRERESQDKFRLNGIRTVPTYVV